MSISTPEQAEIIYQLKITLRGISPLIWRRLLVSAETTIAQLHAIVQTAMGWEDVYPHRFRIYGRAYGVARPGGLLFADDPTQVRLSRFRLRAGERFLYEYDLGDLWQHDIRLEDVRPAAPQHAFPVCVAGAGACPPEDCGGPAGYRRLVDERSSWPALLQMQDDVVLVAERLLAFLEGGPRPTDGDTAFVSALDRMNDRLEEACTGYLPCPPARRRWIGLCDASDALSALMSCVAATHGEPQEATGNKGTPRPRIIIQSEDCCRVGVHAMSSYVA
jgi:hypothetical protein